MRRFIQILSMLALIAPAATSAVVAFGIDFDPDDATTQASISVGGYLTPHGPGLYSGGSDWDLVEVEDQTLGTFFQLPTFQAGFDAVTPGLGNPGSSVTLGGDDGIAGLDNVRDTVFTKWDDGYGLSNLSGKDLVVFEKGDSEAYAIRVRVASSGTWTGWYHEIFNPTGEFDFATPTEYELSDLGVGMGQAIDAVEITNLTAADKVSTSATAKPEFSGLALADLGFGFVTFDSDSSELFVPARRSSSAPLKPFEEGKHDPDILLVAGLHAAVAVPLPPAALLLVPALAVIGASRRRHGA